MAGKVALSMSAVVECLVRGNMKQSVDRNVKEQQEDE